MKSAHVGKNVVIFKCAKHAVFAEVLKTALFCVFVLPGWYTMPDTVYVWSHIRVYRLLTHLIMTPPPYKGVWGVREPVPTLNKGGGWYLFAIYLYLIYITLVGKLSRSTQMDVLTRPLMGQRTRCNPREKSSCATSRIRRRSRELSATCAIQNVRIFA